MGWVRRDVRHLHSRARANWTWPPGSLSCRRMTQTYSLPAPCWDFTSLVARSMLCLLVGGLRIGLKIILPDDQAASDLGVEGTAVTGLLATGRMLVRVLKI
jgi:hypothetical protein